MNMEQLIDGYRDADKYQSDACRFATENAKTPAYLVAGLAEETGELCGKFAKAVRNGTLNADFTLTGKTTAGTTEGMVKELGDVLWFCANLAEWLGVPLSEVMAANIVKLTDRAERGVIVGEGDER
jgi:NTP pyrophosphatase (non-canonical NTP hydrolase)